MKYTKEYFDSYIERRNTRSVKWDGCCERFNIDPRLELLPMWIADMDFKAPEEVIEALTKRAESGIYGYVTKPDSFYLAIIGWAKRRCNWDVKKEWINFVPGIIPGFNIAYQQFSNPGEGIIVQNPVYYPFMDGIANNERKMVVNRLIENKGKWSINFDELEQQLKDPDNKIMVLPNPHNPTGRCWSYEELKKIGELCADNNVLLIADEVHADLMIGGRKHISVGTLSKKITDNMILLNSPSKTFNLAGLQTAYAIIPNPEIRAKFEKGINANRIFNMNWFGQIALETAYNQCEEYVDALCCYVEANMDYVISYIEKNLPMLKIEKPEGTYMVWVDFRDTGMSTEEIERFIIEKAHIAVDMGTWFGKGGEGFLRFNLACPRSLVEQAMQQLSEAFN